jgi:hypothetical protein
VPTAIEATSRDRNSTIDRPHAGGPFSTTKPAPARTAVAAGNRNGSGIIDRSQGGGPIVRTKPPAARAAVSGARMRETFHAVDAVLRENPEVGAYNRAILTRGQMDEHDGS